MSEANHLRSIFKKGVIFFGCFITVLSFERENCDATSSEDDINIQSLYQEELARKYRDSMIKQCLTEKKLEIVSPEIPNIDFEYLEREAEIAEVEMIEQYEIQKVDFEESENHEKTLVKKRNETASLKDIEDTLETSVIDITEEEYYRLCMMVFHEAGHHSWKMQNGCASAAVNQVIYHEDGAETMMDVLESGRFGSYPYKFRDYADDGSYVVREIVIADITDSVYSAVNEALSGYDVNYAEIGYTLGFYAPNHCSDETNDYMNAHVRDTTYIENVRFFHTWVD